MAEYSNTLAGILALNDRNLSGAEASDILNSAPLLRALYAQPASQGGTQHKYQRDLTEPGVGFRAIGNGIVNAAGTFEIVTETCALLDATCIRDKGAAVGFTKGPVGYMDREGLRSLKAAFFKMECAILRSNVNKAFVGLPGNAFFDQITSDVQVVDAGGSGGKSVWLIRSAADGISIIAGNEGRIDMSAEDSECQIAQGNGYYTALVRSMMGWFGLQVASKYDGARIVNLDATASHTLTDDHISEALVKAKVGMAYNLCVMSRTSLLELQKSRTAVNPTGSPAPFPTYVVGTTGDQIPIIVSDGLTESESAVNTTTTGTTTSTTA